MKKTKQKRKPRPSFPHVTGRTQTARIADHLSRGARIGPSGIVARVTEEPSGFVAVYSGQVGKVDVSNEVDRAFPALNEGETGIRPAVERCPYTPIERRAKESNGRDEAEKAKARAFVSENKVKRAEQVAAFAFAFGPILKAGLFETGFQLAGVPGLEPIARLVADCSEVTDSDACRLIHKLATNDNVKTVSTSGALEITVGGLPNALLQIGADPASNSDLSEAVLLALLNKIRDLQNKRARGARKRVIRASKRKRRGKRK